MGAGSLKPKCPDFGLHTVPKSLLKYKDYEIHAVGSSDGEKKNLNIASWVMQTAMGGKRIALAFYKPDYTLELVKASGKCCVSLLAESQAGLLTRLGRRSGRNADKLKNLDFALDEAGNPYLSQAVGFLQCEVLSWTDCLDHELAICKVLKSKVLNPDSRPLTLDFLRERKWVRG